MGVVSSDEPFTKLQTVGLIMAEDGRKMSKRWGNIVNPDDVVSEYGADTLRLYEMFMGPFDQSVAWSTKSMAGSYRFIERVVKLSEKVTSMHELATETTILLNQTIKKVGEDIEGFKFNTAISALMILLNALEKEDKINEEIFSIFVRLIAPFAPHVAEELWQNLSNTSSVHTALWPEADASKLTSDTVTMAIQIARKMRGTIDMKRDSEDSEVLSAIKGHEMYQKYVGEAEPKKVIVVKNKIVNIVI
jgi:leucyl-tRNA synthetase